MVVGACCWVGGDTIGEDSGAGEGLLTCTGASGAGVCSATGAGAVAGSADWGADSGAAGSDLIQEQNPK